MLKSQVLPLRDDPRIQMMRRSSSVNLAFGLLLFGLALEPGVTAPPRSQLGR